MVKLAGNPSRLSALKWCFSAKGIRLHQIPRASAAMRVGLIQRQQTQRGNRSDGKPPEDPLVVIPKAAYEWQKLD